MFDPADSPRYPERDPITGCAHCHRIEGYPGEFVTCRKCGELVCDAHTYADAPDLCFVCFELAMATCLHVSRMEVA